MPRVHYLPHSEFSRLLPQGMKQELRREVFVNMLRLNALARCHADRHSTPDCALDSNLTVLSQVCQSEIAEANNLLIEAYPRNTALVALRHALGHQADLFDEELTTPENQNFQLATPGQTLSLAVGTAMAKSLRGEDIRTVAVLSNADSWQSGAATALPESHRNFLKRLCVIAPYTATSETDRDDLELRMIACGWTVVSCKAEEIGHYLKRTTYLQSPTLLIYPQTEVTVPKFEALSSELQAHTISPRSTAELFEAALDALDELLASEGLPGCKLELLELDSPEPDMFYKENLQTEATREMLQQMAENESIVVIDASRSSDRYLRAIRRQYPSRFLSCSSNRDARAHAAGVSTDGLLPVVISESQTFSGSVESATSSPVVHVMLNAGLSAADLSNASPKLYDIAQYNSHNNGIMLHPCNGDETLAAIRYALKTNSEDCCLRLQGGELATQFVLPKDYFFVEGRGSLLRTGDDAIVFAYGSKMLAECLRAADLLAAHDFQLAVVNLPWLNRLDLRWLRPLISLYEQVHIVEDHASVGALGDCMLRECTKHGLLERRQLHTHGADAPATTLVGDALLQHHELDFESLAAKILKTAGERRLSRKALQAARKLREHSKSSTTEESAMDSLLDIDVKLLKSL